MCGPNSLLLKEKLRVGGSLLMYGTVLEVEFIIRVGLSLFYPF